MFKLILVIFLASSGMPQAVENLEGTPDLRLGTVSTWRTSEWPTEYPDLASCTAQSEALQAALDVVNAEGKWQLSAQCATRGSLCDWLPGLYPGGVIPPGNLPPELQDKYDAECGGA